MKVELALSTVGQSAPHQYCTTFLINDSVAIDAGTLGLLYPLERQLAVRNVFLSHCHIDHLATLPLFLDNVFDPGPDCVTVYANDNTQQCLANDVFNDRLWPDFIRLSADGATKFLALQELQSERPVEVDGVRITPVLLNHNVPTLGFIIESDDVAVAFVSDTSPTDRIWELLHATPSLQAVFLECSFPNSHRWLADEAFHLCPELFRAELDKLNRDVDVFAVHVKPAFYDEIARELAALNLPAVRLAVPAHPYEFGG